MTGTEKGTLFHESHHIKSKTNMEWYSWCGSCRGKGRIDSTGWAAIFILAGLILLAEATGYSGGYDWWNGWSLFFTGAGIIVLTGTLARYFISDQRKPILWDFICGFILLVIGLGDYINWGWLFAVIMITAGIFMLKGVCSREK